MTTIGLIIGLNQLCKQQPLPDEIENKIKVFSWKEADIPDITDLQQFDTVPINGERVFIDNWPKWGWTAWPRQFLPKKVRERKRNDTLRSKNVVIHTLPDGLEVSAEMGRHKVAQLLKDAIVEDATGFVEGELRSWTNQFWDPDIFNDIVGVLQRNRERQDRRELRRMFWQRIQI